MYAEEQTRAHHLRFVCPSVCRCRSQFKSCYVVFACCLAACRTVRPSPVNIDRVIQVFQTSSVCYILLADMLQRWRESVCVCVRHSMDPTAFVRAVCCHTLTCARNHPSTRPLATKKRLHASVHSISPNPCVHSGKRHRNSRRKSRRRNRRRSMRISSMKRTYVM